MYTIYPKSCNACAFEIDEYLRLINKTETTNNLNFFHFSVSNEDEAYKVQRYLNNSKIHLDILKIDSSLYDDLNKDIAESHRSSNLFLINNLTKEVKYGFKFYQSSISEIEHKKDVIKSLLNNNKNKR